MLLRTFMLACSVGVAFAAPAFAAASDAPVSTVPNAMIDESAMREPSLDAAEKAFGEMEARYDALSNDEKADYEAKAKEIMDKFESLSAEEKSAIENYVQGRNNATDGKQAPK